MRWRERKPSRAAKPLMWGIFVGAAAVLLIGFAWYDLASQRRQVADLRANLAGRQSELKEAQATVTRVSFEEQWSTQDPRILACSSSQRFFMARGK